MSIYRLSGGPFIEFGSFFVNAFVLNLETPALGPYVPTPVVEGHDPDEDLRFQSVPLRNATENFHHYTSAILQHLPPPDPHRPLGGHRLSREGLAWYLTHRRFDSRSRGYRVLFEQRGRHGRRMPTGRTLTFEEQRGAVLISVSEKGRSGASVLQESLWSPRADRNMDLLRVTLFSKKGPPRWRRLSVPRPETLPLLSLALYGGIHGVRLFQQCDRDRYWYDARAFEDTDAIENWVQDIFQERGPGALRTYQKIAFRDPAGTLRQEPVFYVRWFQPWKRARWRLEITYRRLPSSKSVPSPLLDLARRALDLTR